MSKTEHPSRPINQSPSEAATERRSISGRKRWTLPAVTLSVVAILVWVAGCSDPGPCNPTCVGILPDTGLIVSNPIPITALGASSPTGGALRTSSEIAYVSLPAGSVPDGGIATITNTRTGETVQAAMGDGGFDPVAIGAEVGDFIEVHIELVGGGGLVMGVTVNSARRPIVVRTEPPPHKRDVPLNANLVVVFSEPMSLATVEHIQVLRGETPVSGTAILSSDGLRVTFQPAALLEPNADYVLSVPAGIDAQGDSLDQPATTQFTTGTTVAAAEVATTSAALFVNPDRNQERTFQSDAVLGQDGRVTGTWSIFYATRGDHITGRVTCFSILNGNAAWVAGIDDSTGSAWGWRVIDNGPPEAGVRDQLSLAYQVVSLDLASPDDWCATTPTVLGSTDITVYDLTAGDLSVTGTAPPHPPQPPDPPGAGVSLIAYSASPFGGIKVRAADGSGIWFLTTDSGDVNPAWSPDGHKLAFHRDRPTPRNGDIYVINYDGSGLQQLTSGPGNDRNPAWSSDGALIAFDRDSTIQIMNATDGTALRQLTTGPDAHPTWSPDGTRIAFVRSDRIYVINTDGSGLTRLTGDSGVDDAPAWSPDGAKIAFQHTRPIFCLPQPCSGPPEISVMNSNGTGVTRLDQGWVPTWSPDGQLIAFSYSSSGDWLLVMHADGSGAGLVGQGFTPAWSPVGSVPPWSGVVVPAPTDLIATPVSDTEMVLTWQNHASGEDFFQLDGSNTGPNGTFEPLATGTAFTTRLEERGLTPGTEYCYRLRSYQGNFPGSPVLPPTYSAFSTTVCATTLGLAPRRSP